ncbi:MAG: NUDIX hydrolase [Acidimicrobiia bacterium]
MRDWTVGGGVIVEDDRLLLVRNRRRNGRDDWSTPGGVIDPGESLLDGLTREVREETGLEVRRWSAPLYRVRCEAPDLGWTLSVQAHLALDWAGELQVEDPDGIVVEARFVPVGDCGERLAGCHPWVREPLGAWLDGRWDGDGPIRSFEFHVAGTDPATLRVTRR